MVLICALYMIVTVLIKGGGKKEKNIFKIKLYSKRAIDKLTTCSRGSSPCTK